MEPTTLRQSLKDIMQRENLTAINVGSACDVDPLTVERFLDGIGTPRRLTLRAFQEFVTSKQVSPEKPLKRASA